MKEVFSIHKVSPDIYTGYYFLVKETGEEMFIDDLFIDSDGGAFISHMYLEGETVIHDQLLIEGDLFSKWESLCKASHDNFMKRVRQERPDLFSKRRKKKKR